MKYDFEMLIGLAGFSAGLIGIGYAIGSHKKLNDISNKLDKSIDELSKSVEVEIPDYLVEKAVKNAVDREAKDAAHHAVNKIIRDMENDIKKEVRSTVDSKRWTIEEDVSKEIKKQVSNIDISSLKRKVIEEEKEAAAEKLDGSLDEILEKFNADLENVSKIYKSIAGAISKENSKNVTLSLT